jgi:hypothetical protein
MSKNLRKQQDGGDSAADRRAAAPNGELPSPTSAAQCNDPVSSGPGPDDTPGSSGTSPGRGEPGGECGLVRNIVLVEGPAHESHQALAEVQVEFPAAELEPTEETERHRALFRTETHELPETPPAGAITLAVRFQSDPPEDSESVPDALVRVHPIVERWRNALTIAQPCFDPRRVPSAAAMIRCLGPHAVSASPEVDDSGRGQMSLYSRIQQHFCGGYNACFRERLEDIGEVDIAYPYREEWDEEYSPLGLEFLSEDPARQEWGLSDGLDSAPESDFLFENGYLPPEGVTVAAPTNWIDGLTLILRAEDAGVHASFDDKGRMLISGYGLRAAGLITPNLKPTTGLTAAERSRFKLGDPPTERTAMIAFLQLYAYNLDYLIGQTGDDEQASRLRGHLAGALSWLLPHAARPSNATFEK